jgi:hypothetical protein
MTKSLLTIDTAHFAERLDCFRKSATDTTVHFDEIFKFREIKFRFSHQETMRIGYTTIVDSDVNYSSKHFADEVAAYLADPDGWRSEGYNFVRSKTPDVIIHLSSPEYLGKNGCRDSSLSCAEMNGTHMYLNSMRWTEGASPSKLELIDYRQYMVSHEMGHILGHEHVKCPSIGAPAPIMLQQTKGIGKCKPNTKLTEKDRKKK